MNAHDPLFTVRIEPALRTLARDPLVGMAWLARRYSCGEDEIREWLKTFNGGSKVLKPARIDEVKRETGSITGGRTVKVEVDDSVRRPVKADVAAAAEEPQPAANPPAAAVAVAPVVAAPAALAPVAPVIRSSERVPPATPAKRRGRPPGTKNKPKPDAKPAIEKALKASFKPKQRAAKKPTRVKVPAAVVAVRIDPVIAALRSLGAAIDVAIAAQRKAIT